jgi:RNA-directed DNA polymerase
MNTVNPMYRWEGINWAKIQRNVFKLQKRIYRASERGDVKAVRQLQRLLTHAWQARLLAVRTVSQDNPGNNTAGIDPILKLSNPRHISMALSLRLHGTSKPPQRVRIPTPGKPLKSPAGMPTMMTRAQQALVHLALEPEWEAKFAPNSYGFRPGRSAHDAVAAIINGIQAQDKYILNTDIEKGVDRINHQKLLAQLNTFPTFRRHINAWLKSGMMDGDRLFPTQAGFHQGREISSLLANIALHGLEDHLHRTLNRQVAHGREKQVSVISYADRLVILDTDLDVIRKCQKITAAFLAKLGLKISETQSRVTHTFKKYEGSVGLDFLGFHIRQYPCGNQPSSRMDGTAKHRDAVTIIKPSQAAIKQHLKTIDDVIAKHKNASQASLINALNPIIREWTDYYATTSSRRPFKKLGSILFYKLRGWAIFRRANHQNKTEIASKYWGVNRGLGWKFITPDNRSVLATHQATWSKRRIKVLDKSSPFDGDDHFWHHRLATHPKVNAPHELD